MTDFLESIVPSKQLAQLRPADTTAASIYTLPANTRTKVNAIVVCNQTGTGESYRIFHDVDGTTYDETTALFYDVAIAANTTAEWEPKNLWLDNVLGNIAVRTSTNSAVTFTLYGEEHQKTIEVN